MANYIKSYNYDKNTLSKCHLRGLVQGKQATTCFGISVGLSIWEGTSPPTWLA